MTSEQLFESVIIDTITAIRTNKGANNIPAATCTDVVIEGANVVKLTLLVKYKEVIERMANCRLKIIIKEEQHV